MKLFLVLDANGYLSIFFAHYCNTKHVRILI